METKITELKNARRKVTATIEEQEMAGYYELALKRLSGIVSVAGFRDGKAPLNIVRQKIGDDRLKEEVLGIATRVVWDELDKTLAERPISDPVIENAIVEEGQKGVFEFTYDVRPKIKLNGPDKIKISPKTTKEVTDQDIEAILENLSFSRAEEVIADKKIETGDKALVDFEGSVGGVRLDKLTANSFSMLIGRSGIVPGFEEKIIGLKKGDKKDFKLKFPKDFYDQDLQNKEAQFKVEIKEVYELKKPEYGDKYAEMFGHKTMDGLKTAIKEQVGEEKKVEYENEIRGLYIEELLKKTETDLPESLVHSEYHRAEDDFYKFLEGRKMKVEEWIARRKTTLEEIKKGWQDMAEKSVRTGLGLTELAKQQQVELKDSQDYQAFLTKVVEEAIKK